MKIKQLKKKTKLFCEIEVGTVFKNLRKDCPFLLKVNHNALKNPQDNNVMSLEFDGKYHYDDDASIIAYPNAELDPGEPQN